MATAQAAQQAAQQAARGPSYFAAGPPPAAAKAGPAYKTWSDEEGALGRGDTTSCCVKFKFAIWLLVVVLLVAAAVGLSVTMVYVQKDRNKNQPPSPPPPPSPPGGVDPDGPSGGGGSGGDGGNTGPLPTPEQPPFAVPAGTQAIWYDEFSGDKLNTAKWRYDTGTGDWGWGNNELEYYTDDKQNVRVADGNLYITALEDGAGGYTSGRINTKQTAGFHPGMQLTDGTAFSSVHIEARMKLPQPGQGLWPAFWLFPTDLVYGKWAASGEIDIMESINDMQTIAQGLHFGGPDPENQKNMTRARQADRSPYSDGFHTMAVDWEADKITMTVDGRVSKVFLPREQDPEFGWWTSAANAPPNAPFASDPFYIILNLAVGGLWPKNPDASTPFPATLTVDYVRVWGTPE